MEEELIGIDKAIVSAIRNSRSPLSTYGIAKDMKVSWSTANIHCYKLKSIGVISESKEQSRFGQTKVFWHIKT